MSPSSKLVIKRHRPVHVVAIMLISCAVISIAIWVFLDESQWSYIMSSLAEAKKSQQLWQENTRMKKTITKLEERVVMLERTAQVDRQTTVKLQQGMVEQQDEIYKLKKELEFYQGVMTSAGQSKGLSIQGLQIEETSQPRSYYFKLILTHVSKSDKVAAGKLTIALEGVQGDTARTIDIQELTLSESLPLSFKFGSFRRIEGSIMLPADFVPHRVIVRAQLDGNGKLPEIQRIFDWSEAVTRGEI